LAVLFVLSAKVAVSQKDEVGTSEVKILYEVGDKKAKWYSGKDVV
jgi:hypothetical protein